MQKERMRTPHGTLMLGSRRGYSSHQYNPFFILADHGTTETAGRCWSMQFVYSGGFRAEIAHDQYDQTRIQMGMADEKFSYPLEPGESLTAPEVIMSFSGKGLEHLSHHLHKCVREHVCRGKYADSPRPILINSWEACYFDFTGEKILDLAKKAKDLGVEMLVLDDGWFGKRNDDLRALGDWYANEDKLGMPLGELVKKVNDIGLKFGIWTEPEMISEDSDLYRAHPDWAMAVPDKKPVRGRSQLVLDMSRKDVRDYVYDSVCSVLDSGNIEYLKWDYNSCINDVYSHKADDQGRVLYDYMIGLYDVLERLNNKYPDVMIEGCSGGGGRFDAGMLYYTPQIWCSDNTDAIDRLFIHYGTSFAYPSCTVGSHVSACPNHQTGRNTPLKTRGIVAMSGTFGYELDPSGMNEEEKAEVREQIRRFHLLNDLVRTGNYYRLSDPFKDDYAAWSYVSEDGREALVSAVIMQNHGNMHNIFVKLRGLISGEFYRDVLTGRMYQADALMDAGMPLARPCGDAAGYEFHLEIVRNA
jgi:alpha-galactosidase